MTLAEKHGQDSPGAYKSGVLITTILTKISHVTLLTLYQVGIKAESPAGFDTKAMFKGPPHRFADGQQEIWIPACFAIPWLLGQQARRKKQQMRQSKAMVVKSIEKVQLICRSCWLREQTLLCGMHTLTLPDPAARSNTSA